MSWKATAPANIALIKYMGQTDSQRKLPCNPSFSYTLPHLTSTVQLSCIEAAADRWESLPCHTMTLSSSAQQRFLTHLASIKARYAYQGGFLVQSGNDFPKSMGIASSASSFAALTRCALQALSDLSATQLPSLQEQARISRQGSGSSCRSFYAPWCLWEDDRTYAIEIPYTTLLHQLVLCDRTEKTVSSSEAHRRVCTSPFFEKRPLRAAKRLEHLLAAMHAEAWDTIFKICLEEFKDMHHLFETASPPFSYVTPACHALIARIEDYWKQYHDGPIMTMDAGATLHLLYRPDQEKLADTFKQTLLEPYDLL